MKYKVKRDVVKDYVLWDVDKQLRERDYDGVEDEHDFDDI